MKTRPWLWSRRICPVRHLKKVLLPAPLGPMRQRSSRSASEKLTLLTAWTPPKRIDRSRVSSTVSLTGAPCPTSALAGPSRGHGPAWQRPGARPSRRVSAMAAPAPRARRLPPADAALLAARAPARQRRQQAARQQQHHQDQDRAENERVVDQGLLAEQQLQVAEDDRADHRADQRAEAADDGPDDHLGRLAEAEHARGDDLGPVGEEAAGEAGHRRADREDRGLVQRRAVAEQLDPRLVLADADQHLAEEGA